jgi:hypothetical protein
MLLQALGEPWIKFYRERATSTTMHVLALVQAVGCPQVFSALAELLALA